ncbi:MAG: hypothetical protein M3373_03665, partial [Gemmatimonadota bacterium]|nr:hypothetical protein [Gemmatimonadota bacterium]
AAASVLVVASSLGTVLVMRGDRPTVAETARPVQPGATALLSFAAAEAEYMEVSASLAATVRERRSTLAPETVAAVERSLTIIDQAIGEARAALARDPGNHDLVEILSASYEQKVDLLRRATELLPRS